jgi:hypothetical protein
MAEQQSMTREQYVNLSKIDSLARQNAQQAVRIADLETQVNLLQMQLQEQQQQAQPQEKIPGEDPVEAEVDDLGNAH